jgi:uncharacterized GH25 family protein
MAKKWTVLLVLSVVSFLVSGHEFWLEADKFYYKRGDYARVGFRTGEDFIGHSNAVAVDRIERLHYYAGPEVTDLRKTLREDTLNLLQVSLDKEGTHLLLMETKPSFIKLDGEKFTEYLHEDGLDDIFYEREKKGTSGDSASEFYSRHSKLILQAGAQEGADLSKKIFNLPIEIVPDRNPNELRKGNRIGFTILFEGKPLFGAKVKVWNRYRHQVSVQNIFSEQNGKIETHVSNPGAWMVSVVKMIPSKDAGVQYRSYWGTLVFGVRE